MARLTIKLLNIVPPFTLAVDRTEWQLGKSWVNVLMLSVSYGRMAIPLFWTVIEEKGCCADAEKQALMTQFLEEFSADRIQFISADREARFKRLAAISGSEKDRFSITDQGECANHRQRRKTDQGGEDVPNFENR